MSTSVNLLNRSGRRVVIPFGLVVIEGTEKNPKRYMVYPIRFTRAKALDLRLERTARISHTAMRAAVGIIVAWPSFRVRK